MITRQRGGQLEPLDLEIEAAARRNRSRIRQEQLRERLETEEMEEDNRNNAENGRGLNEIVGDEHESDAHEGVRVDGNDAQGRGVPPQGPFWNNQAYYPHPQYPYPPRSEEHTSELQSRI